MKTELEHRFPYLFALLKLQDGFDMTKESCDTIIGSFNLEWLATLDIVIGKSNFSTICNVPKTSRMVEVHEFLDIVKSSLFYNIKPMEKENA